MTQEMVNDLAEKVAGPMQWLTPEEEWLVMELVAQKLFQRRMFLRLTEKEHAHDDPQS